MALTDCSLVTDLLRDCRNSVGGVAQILVTEFQNVTVVTSSSGTVTAITKTSGTKFWVYNLEKENAEFTEVEQNSVENGTLFYEGTLTFSMKKMSAAKRNNFYALAQNILMVIIKDNNGKYWLMGETNGADKAGTNEIRTGKAMGDLNGYNVSLVSKEPQPAREISSGIISALQSA